MSKESKAVTGGCMCGAVRYEAVGAAISVSHCHCHSCRRHSGGPVVTFVAFKAAQVRFTKGARRIYNSSPGVGRTFCGDCGSPLTWEGVWGDWADIGPLVEVHISTLDDPEAFVPQNHMFHGERIAWFDVADGLPRYEAADLAGAPARHGPVDEGLPG